MFHTTELPLDIDYNHPQDNQTFGNNDFLDNHSRREDNSTIWYGIPNIDSAIPAYAISLYQIPHANSFLSLYSNRHKIDHTTNYAYSIIEHFYQKITNKESGCSYQQKFQE